MKIHRFWARGTAEGKDINGEPLKVSARGSSDESRESALRAAAATARSILQKLSKGEGNSGRYPYPDRALAEPVLREFSSASGESIALLTRNGYGAVVLNTAAMMIVDIDLPANGGGALQKLFSLFGKKSAEPTLTPLETAAAEKISALASKERLSMRLYRTKAGLRAIVTNRPVQPKSSEATRILRELNADPLYCRLCESQESFRARLSPKPWRIGADRPPVQFPFEAPQAIESMQRWEEQYGEMCRGWAVCELIGEYGGKGVAGEFAEILALHDAETGITTGKPLA